jgi:hypothetical protein
MIQATAGRLNKQIAYGIGIIESTVKVHRVQWSATPRIAMLAPSENPARSPENWPRARASEGYVHFMSPSNGMRTDDGPAVAPVGLVCPRHEFKTQCRTFASGLPFHIDELVIPTILSI